MCQNSSTLLFHHHPLTTTLFNHIISPYIHVYGVGCSHRHDYNDTDNQASMVSAITNRHHICLYHVGCSIPADTIDTIYGVGCIKIADTIYVFYRFNIIFEFSISP